MRATSSRVMRSSSATTMTPRALPDPGILNGWLSAIGTLATRVAPTGLLLRRLYSVRAEIDLVEPKREAQVKHRVGAIEHAPSLPVGAELRGDVLVAETDLEHFGERGHRKF